jgi:hypothetical protein
MLYFTWIQTAQAFSLHIYFIIIFTLRCIFLIQNTRNSYTVYQRTPPINFKVAYFSVLGIILVNFTIKWFPLIVRKDISPFTLCVNQYSYLKKSEINSRKHAVQLNKIQCTLRHLYLWFSENKTNKDHLLGIKFLTSDMISLNNFKIGKVNVNSTILTKTSN